MEHKEVQVNPVNQLLSSSVAKIEISVIDIPSISITPKYLKSTLLDDTFHKYLNSSSNISKTLDILKNYSIINEDTKIFITYGIRINGDFNITVVSGDIRIPLFKKHIKEGERATHSSPWVVNIEGLFEICGITPTTESIELDVFA
jgi:hypothetical protein